jgi:hypothetical protein
VFSGRVLLFSGVTALLFTTGLVCLLCGKSGSAGSRRSPEAAVAPSVEDNRPPATLLSQVTPVTMTRSAGPKLTHAKQDGNEAGTVSTGTAPASTPAKPATLITYQAPAAAALAEPASDCGTGTYGTRVKFVSSPEEAAAKALQEHKLLFTLHISGNFEDSRFT